MATQEIAVATVSQLCETIAIAARMPLGDVKKFARELIDAGELPKALGSSIPQTDMRDRAKLILAVAASERPSLCVKAMRDRYKAKARFNESKLIAGEALADQLAQLAAGSPEAFQLWNYSDLEVSRGGLPRVKFRVNENIRHFDDFKGADQPEFLGGYHLAESSDEMHAAMIEFQATGLPVSAFVPGQVLIYAAHGTREAAMAAEIAMIKHFEAKPE